MTESELYLKKKRKRADLINEEESSKITKINNYPRVIFQNCVMSTLISLKPDFKIERKRMRFFEVNDPQKNKYLSPEQQAECCVSMDDSSFSFPNGDILEGQYNFCLTAELLPRLLCSKTEHHSFLANGKKVLGVGTLDFDNGRLFKISNHSGHYKPTNDEMMQVIKALSKASDGDLKVYTSYSKPTPEIFSVLDVLQQDDFEELTPIAENEEINIETGVIETIQIPGSNYQYVSSILSNESLRLKDEVLMEYQQFSI